MNRDDIIRMAEEAGLCRDDEVWYSRSDVDADVTTDDLERFAALIAAQEREAVEKAVEQLNRLSSEYRKEAHIFGDSIRTAVAAEREACACMAEECVNIERLADDIRARGER